MRRREFITLVGGSVVGWPLVARAQSPERVSRICILMNQAADNPEGRARFAAFQDELTKLGWAIGRNVQIEDRWGAGDLERYSRYAAELVALAPDVLVGSGGPITRALQRATQTIPIVFAIVPDPIGGGYVRSLARPGGNPTGFMQFEYSFSGKWVQLLKQMVPAVSRAAVLINPEDASDAAQFAVIQAVGTLLGVEVSPIDAGAFDEIERGVAQFANFANGGLIVTAGRTINFYERIIALSALHRLPTIYPLRFYVGSGGLISYGPDLVDQYRGVATYVHRILKGAKPADLPVQAPTKYELVINRKTAAALGLVIPDKLLSTADEVIE